MGHPISGAIAAVRREARDAVTLELTTEGEPHRYRAGQFLTIDPHQFPQIAPVLRDLEARKGHTEPARAYSLSSAPHEPTLAITLKEEAPHPGGFPPLLSPLLMHELPPGSRIELKGFDGLYTLPDDAPEHDLLLHLCSGSGIVPNFGLIKEALHMGLPGRQVLLYQSAARDEIIFGSQLAALESAHPGRVKVRHFLDAAPSAATGAPTAMIGSFGRAEIERALEGAKAPLVFLCGPGVTSWSTQEARRTGIPATPRFIERIRADLKSLGLDRHKIRTEIFG